MEDLRSHEFIRLNFEVESYDKSYAAVISKADRSASLINFIDHKVDP